MDKLVVLGFDGLDPELIEKYIPKLPNIQKIKKEGIFGKISSIIPPITSGAWTSMVTGKNPGKTGILGFHKRIALGKFLPVDSINVQHPKLWDLIGRNMGQSIVLNMPLTGDINKFNGLYTSGRFGSLRTYPQDLKKIIETQGYSAEIPKFSNFKEIKDFLKYAIDLEEKRIKVALNLIAKYKADLVFQVFNIPDAAHHYLGEEELILELYKHIDDIIGRFAEISSNIFVVSDHGFGKQPVDYQLNLLQLMVENGFVKLGGLRSSVKMKETAKKILSFLGLYPKKQIVKHSMVHYNVDWGKTAVDIPPDVSALYVNRKRDSFKNMDTLYRELRFCLENLEYKGKKYKTKLYRREDVYHGDKLNELPEFVFEGSTRLVFRDRFTGGTIFSSSGSWKHVHDSKACFLGKGSMLKKNMEVKGSICDIAPTVLYALGLPILEDMDGRVLDIFSKNYKEEHRIQSTRSSVETRGKNLSRKEQQKITKGLRDLGYIE